MVALLGSGLGTTFTLYFFVGINLLSFFCCFGFFPYVGIGVRLRGSKLVGLWIEILVPIFPPMLEIGLHFLNDSGVRVKSLVLQGLHLITWHVPSLLNMYGSLALMLFSPPYPPSLLVGGI